MHQRHPGTAMSVRPSDTGQANGEKHRKSGITELRFALLRACSLFYMDDDDDDDDDDGDDDDDDHHLLHHSPHSHHRHHHYRHHHRLFLARRT
ncbi:hypothetical protein HZH68_004358 [Vespula germanica]|uniref:Uncharacterized protein n=1 Tax=Vespula germanica TaxID=30212 RepID=A0A834KQ09_VESGE|nr:hypothetical protein HZH68_004358 [Vespula germanica]